MDRKSLARLQGSFNVVNGLWPLVHMRSFEAIFGPKKDKWLVRTVAGLMVTNGAAQARSGSSEHGQAQARMIGIGTAATLAAVDLIYAPPRRISRMYLVDAVTELGWIYLWLTSPRAAGNTDEKTPYGKLNHSMAQRIPLITATAVAVPEVPSTSKRGPVGTTLLVAVGLLSGAACVMFAMRMMVPPGEPRPAVRPRLERDGASPATATPVASTTGDAAQPEELLVPSTEPVEISIRMRPGEWTDESLVGSVEDYRQQVRDMGAPESQIVTKVDRTEGGGAVVVVRWDRTLPL
ncbi:hypothetical protein [Arthrobacter sp. fls2-241-R2A-200]|uniref:hypothetical protein n=1 Tax=Arthrobacter sp. fls2-241-R2A-200 TaxID=3040281 RepID=UPI00255045FD|nr:hypothetical protein [Arthrobacter sp. fls2-241-R2A-200]